MPRPKLPTAARKVILNITVNPELKTMIKHVAQEEKTTVSALISDILTNYLINREKALKKAKKRFEKQIESELIELKKHESEENEFKSILEISDLEF